LVEKRFWIDAGGGDRVSAMLNRPESCRRGETPGLILAHGAKNDLEHPLLAAVAHGLASMGAASVLRFNFSYSEHGAPSPDRLERLESVYRRAHDELVDDPLCAPGPVFMGGKSLGARVAAGLAIRHHEGEGLLTNGLVFLGYPLHGPGKSDNPHLDTIGRLDVPSLFVEGTRDPFCSLDVLRPALTKMPVPGELHIVEDGGHSLEVPRSSRRTQEEVHAEVVAAVAAFIEAHS
jgi:predicted alpha/beta-hydrolase family hydrolase